MVGPPKVADVGSDVGSVYVLANDRTPAVTGSMYVDVACVGSFGVCSSCACARVCGRTEYKHQYNLHNLHNIHRDPHRGGLEKKRTYTEPTQKLHRSCIDGFRLDLEVTFGVAALELMASGRLVVWGTLCEAFRGSDLLRSPVTPRSVREAAKSIGMDLSDVRALGAGWGVAL